MGWPQRLYGSGSSVASSLLRSLGAPASSLGQVGSYCERKDAPGLVLLKDSFGNWSFDSVPPEIVDSQGWEGQAALDSVTGTGVAGAGRAVFMRQLPADLCALGSQAKLEFAVKGSGGGTSITVTAGIARYDNQTLVAGGTRKDIFSANLANTGRFDVDMTFAHCAESFDYKYTWITGGTTAGAPGAGNSGLSTGLANSFVFIMITENGTSSNGTTGSLMGVRLTLRSSLAAKIS